MSTSKSENGVREMSTSREIKLNVENFKKCLLYIIKLIRLTRYLVKLRFPKYGDILMKTWKRLADEKKTFL